MRLVRLLLGVGLMGALLWYSNPAAVGASLRGAAPGWLLVAAALVLVDRVANAWRWLLLLRASAGGREVPFASIMRVFFVSGFVGSFLPGSVGGDAVRGVALARLQVPAADAFASVVVDRLLGVTSVVLMATAGLVIARDQLGAPASVALWLAVAGILLGTSLLLFDTGVTAGAAGRWLARVFPAVHRLTGKALGAVRQYGHHRQALVRVFALSIGVQVLRTLEAWSLGRALGVDVAIVWYFAFVPVIVLVMLLPTSVAGLGTGALAFQLLFGTLDVPAAQSFALATLFAALAIIGTLPGGLIFALDRRRSSEGAAADQRK